MPAVMEHFYHSTFACIHEDAGPASRRTAGWHCFLIFLCLNQFNISNIQCPKHNPILGADCPSTFCWSFFFFFFQFAVVLELLIIPPADRFCPVVNVDPTFHFSKHDFSSNLSDWKARTALGVVARFCLPTARINFKSYWSLVCFHGHPGSYRPPSMPACREPKPAADYW